MTDATSARRRTIGRSRPAPATDPVPQESTSIQMGVLPTMTGYALRRAQLAIFDDALKALEPLNLRTGQFSALMIMKTNPGRKQAEIAAALGIQRPNFVAMMDELASRGLAQREPSPLDRRSHALYLTAEGEAVLDAAATALAQHEQRVINRLGTDGKAQLLALLGRLQDLGDQPPADNGPDDL